MITRPTTILGGLPVIAEISFGKDADTPNGAGEHWSEVGAIYWRKRDGSAGKEISESIRDRAEKYDPYFCNLVEGVCEELAYEAAEERRLKTGEPAMVQFFTQSAPLVAGAAR